MNKFLTHVETTHNPIAPAAKNWPIQVTQIVYIGPYVCFTSVTPHSNLVPMTISTPQTLGHGTDEFYLQFHTLLKNEVFIEHNMLQGYSHILKCPFTKGAVRESIL